MAKYTLSTIMRKNRKKFDQGFEGMIPYITNSGGYYTGLESKDVERLAKKIGVAAEALQPPIDGNPNVGSYWKTFSIRVKHGGVIIDTDNPFGEIQYLFVKSHYQVADGKDKITAAKRFLLLNAEEDAAEGNKKAKVRRRAIVHFDTMKPKEMRDALRVMGGKPTLMSDTLVEHELGKIVEEKPKKFLEMWVDNDYAKTYVLIEEAVDANVLRRVRNVFYYNNNTIGNSMEDAVKWWLNPNNQESVGTIKGLTAKKLKM